MNMTTEEQKLILAALEEDTGAGDPTTEATVDPSTMGHAYFLAKADGILSGIEYACAVFGSYSKRLSRSETIGIDITTTDGQRVTRGDRLAEVTAPLDILLGAERVALNFLQRMSGIATTTAKFVEAVRGTKATIIDTRKTVPLLRPFDRYAVRSGGAQNHRYSLGDAILVKDNHIAANNGDIGTVIEKLRVYLATHPKIPVELEVTSIEQFAVVKHLGVGVIDRVLFDNFPLELLREAVMMNAGTFETEGSGGVNLSNVRSIAETGVNYISIGALTHSVTGLDISLEIE